MIRPPAICLDCGRVLGRDIPCLDCGAATPAEVVWEVTPSTAGAWARQVALGMVLAVSGLACFLAAVALCSGWIDEHPGLRFLQVVVAALVVVVGLPVGVVLVGGGVTEALRRRWRWTTPDGARSGTAASFFGRVTEGAGTVRRALARPSMEVPELTSEMVAAAGLRRVRERLGPLAVPLGVTPEFLRQGERNAEVLVVAAVAGLASRGSLRLTLEETTSWTRASRTSLQQGPVARAITLEATDAGAAEPWLERALLDALPAAVARPTGAGAVSSTPYRSAVARTPARAERVPLAAAVGRLVAGQRRRRRALVQGVTQDRASLPLADADAVVAAFARFAEASPTLARALWEGVSAALPGGRAWR